jgi:hypothetical protein
MRKTIRAFVKFRRSSPPTTTRSRCSRASSSTSGPASRYTQAKLTPARELAKKNDTRFPDESEEYRKTRNDLLAEEIEIRRHIWRVAEQYLPAGTAPSGISIAAKTGSRWLIPARIRTTPPT